MTKGIEHVSCNKSRQTADLKNMFNSVFWTVCPRLEVTGVQKCHLNLLKVLGMCLQSGRMLCIIRSVCKISYLSGENGKVVIDSMNDILSPLIEKNNVQTKSG